jgi:hypothetical protein
MISQCTPTNDKDMATKNTWSGESIKVNMSPCLIRHHAMKAYGGMEVQHHPSGDTTTEAVEWGISIGTLYCGEEEGASQ